MKRLLGSIGMVLLGTGCSGAPGIGGSGGAGGTGGTGLDAGVLPGLCANDAQCPAGETCELPPNFHCPAGALCAPVGICRKPVDAGLPGICVSDEGGHCGGFVVNPCICAPGLLCVLSSTPDVGGTCKRPVKPDAGVCVQNVLCIQGSAWDPTLCRCVPQNDGGPQCTTAADCHGILPQICMQCPQPAGGTATAACAHWVCRAGQCVTAICE
jgi:hypothetical protein